MITAAEIQKKVCYKKLSDQLRKEKEVVQTREKRIPESQRGLFDWFVFQLLK